MVQLRKESRSRLRLRPVRWLKLLLVIVAGGVVWYACWSVGSLSSAPRVKDGAQLQVKDATIDSSFVRELPWKRPKLLPSWMADYMTWHQEQRRRLTRDNYQSHRFMILVCLERDPTCGGLSDRLKPLPILLHMAATTQRLFFIHWTRPCALEAFFVPPSQGLDWRKPDWLPMDEARWAIGAERIFKAAESPKPVLCVRLQDQHGGATYYNERQGERAYRRDYASIFWTLFEPTPPLIAAWKREADQFPVDYAAAHFRAYYNVNLDRPAILDVSELAMNCASQLRPGVPIFFASDAQFVLDHVHALARDKHRPIVTTDRGHEALHLDQAKSKNPHDYFDAFVDILHFSGAECISHGQGGFGRLGVLLSKNTTCLQPFITGGRIIQCSWREK